jgi:hypothetical protein
MNHPTHPYRHPEERLRALCALSDVIAPVDLGRFVSRISESPDPETAIRFVLNEMPPASEILTRQWRNLVLDIWIKHHPNIPLIPHWSLSASDVDQTPLLSDTRVFLDGIKRQPIQMRQENHEWLIDSSEISRAAHLLPSQTGLFLANTENEWNVFHLRRLRAILQAARLIRIVKGKLIPIQSRIARFEALPSPLQFYVLWHADVYHVNWGDFSGLWSKYMRLVQEYIPLLWETTINNEPGKLEDRALWAVSVLEAFTPLWDEEGLLDIQKGQGASLQIVQQHALPSIVDRFILRDLFERHGLITITEEFGSLSKFSWTQVGIHVITSEDTQVMPCGNNLLDRSPRLINDIIN